MQWVIAFGGKKFIVCVFVCMYVLLRLLISV